MADSMNGKTVMITGAAGNLGRATAKRFAEAGASLILLDRSMERLNTLASDLGAPNVMVDTVDLGDIAAVQTLIAQVESNGGKIDVLAHTVGGFELGARVHEDIEGGLASLDKMMSLNVRPLWVVGGAVAAHMVAHNVLGKMVFVLARAANKGGAKSAAYTASKAAAQRVMESMSAELRDQGINVNGVLPSTLDTPPNRESMPNADFTKWVTLDDLTSAIYFLASDGARSMHGVNLEVYNRA